ncbi:FAD-dependent oxidoreductase [Amycolatopsis anabasis]|uniref:FAD-dependent oxidoreductase n=1 Tax=Amycolatopsis anabasis TaxID=1840409 RepID=UPI00131CB7AD|nr:FAD-dependent oxidoreductase [Amycolatopsis anabasis]
MTAPPNVLVIGAGIIGLTTAVTLAEAGHHVLVRTAEPPQNTTSAVAGALWGPWMVEPRDRVLPWASQTLDVLRDLAAEPDTGVRLATVREVARADHPSPDWVHLLTDRKPCAPHELPAGYSFGHSYRAPLVDMPAHLDYLLTRLRAAGVELESGRIASLADAAEQARLVVNCAGMGARSLTGDDQLRPVQGHHLVVSNPGLTDVLEADTGSSPDLIAIYPHGDHVVLGGTAYEDAWDRTSDAAVAEAIFTRCLHLEPRLRGAEFLAHSVGLRPTRPSIRIEPERLPGGSTVIHNYGHGGAGVSVAWGCAATVAFLAAASNR